MKQSGSDAAVGLVAVVIRVCGSQLDGELVFRQQRQQAAAQQLLHSPSLPCQRSSELTAPAGTCPKTTRQPSVRPRLLIGLTVLLSKRNIFFGSVLFGCVWLYFISLLWLSFVCKDIFHGETTSSCLTTTTNLKRL